jgi:hypothetical protein
MIFPKFWMIKVKKVKLSREFFIDTYKALTGEFP